MKLQIEKLTVLKQPSAGVERKILEHVGQWIFLTAAECEFAEVFTDTI
jgi:hypothetical protein